MTSQQHPAEPALGSAGIAALSPLLSPKQGLALLSLTPEEVSRLLAVGGWPREERGWTEQRYFDETPEGMRCEFKDGIVIFHSPVTPRHQHIVGFLNTLLWLYVQKKQLGVVLMGPAPLRLRPGLDREPDIFFVANQHVVDVEPRYVSRCDLVIEVTSPGTRELDLVQKVREYQDHGISEYWVIDLANHEVLAHRRGQSGFQPQPFSAGKLESLVVQGFWIKVDWLWQQPLPDALRCFNEIIR